MSNYFPPIPVYPKNYDNNRTLFLVYNTSESITTSENNPWQDSIEIKPVAINQNEIWSDNGYGNINGELFYYNNVEKNENGKIFKFTNCIRNIAGSKTKFNHVGAEVRGFVIAEHHNQLATAIINMENFIGYNFTDDKASLDWRIRNLAELPIILDDFTCPDVTFFFTIASANPTTGTIANYSVEINGSYLNFRIDFGDGTFTTTSLAGTHTYSASGKIDPVIQVNTNNCTIVQSPTQREVATQPSITTVNPPLEIIIPNIPDIPQLIIPQLNLPTVNVQPPPILFPCLDI